MFMWIGRTACWKGRIVTIKQRIDKERVIVALKARPEMWYMALRRDITPYREVG